MVPIRWTVVSGYQNLHNVIYKCFIFCFISDQIRFICLMFQKMLIVKCNAVSETE